MSTTPCRRRTDPALLALWLPIAIGLPLSAAAGDQAPAAAQSMVVGLMVNGSPVADSLLVHREPPRFWLPVAQAQDGRLQTAGREQRLIEGVAHAAFCGEPDRCSFDEGNSLLTITLDAPAIATLHFTDAPPPAPLPSHGGDSGAIVNYDLGVWTMHRPGASAVLDARAFTRYGHGVLRWGRLFAPGSSQPILAQALWQVDSPERGCTAQAGSIQTPDTPLEPGLPLIGLRAGSDARLRPGFNPAPRAAWADVADRALRTDVFVDGLYRQTVEVPFGPYEVDVTPPQTGSSRIDLVTTEINGTRRQQRMDFYASPAMLAPGEQQWSLDAGVMQSPWRLGPEPAQRRSALASASLRRGVHQRLTLQGQALVGHGALRLSLGADTAHARWGAMSAALTWQRSGADPAGRAWLGLAHERLARGGALAVRIERPLSGCGVEPLNDTLADRLRRPCSRAALQAGANPGANWSLHAHAERLLDSRGRRWTGAAMSLRRQVGSDRQLSLSLQQLNIDGRLQRSALLSWSQALGSRYRLQTSLLHDSRRDTVLQWAAQSTPPPTATDADADGRLQAWGSVGGDSDVGARWSQRRDVADWRTEAWAGPQGLLLATGVNGAVGSSGGRWFASRHIDEAFVVVDAGQPDLPVLLDNREVARTDARGLAVVTDVRAWQPNLIGIDTQALPIAYSAPRDQMNVTPPGAVGVTARFDIGDGGITLGVRRPNGEPLPSGAKASISSQSLPSAITSRSELFIERADRTAEIRIEWPGHGCRFTYQPGEAATAVRCVPE